MAQNTNSAAFNQLKPLENTNIGLIVEEHNRYWRKYYDDAEATKKIRQAEEAELKRKLTKDRTLDLPQMTVGEANGYFKDLRVNTLQKEKAELSQLAQEYKNTGDESILLYLNNRKEFYNSANSVTEAAQAYAKYMLEHKDADYNPYLDEGKMEPFKALANGRFTFDKTGFTLTKSDGSEEKFTPQQLNEQLLNYARFSGSPKFAETGLTIAEKIALKDVNGKKVLTPEKRRQGILYWENQLSDNPLQRDSAFAKYNYPKGSEVSGTELVKVSTRLFEEYTLGGIEEKYNSLANQNKLLDIEAKKIAIEKAKEEDKPKTNIGIATDAVLTPYTGGKNPDKVYFVNSDLSENLVFKDNNTTTTLVGIQDQGGKVKMIANQVERIPTYKTDVDGVEYISGYTDGEVKKIDVTDPFLKNRFASQIVVNGESVDNFEQLPNLLKKVSIKEATPNDTSTTKGKVR